MKYFFHPGAEAELDRAVEYYEQHQVGLGLEFAEEVYATIARIVRFPEAWSSITAHTRRCLTNRFPFAVIYQIKTNSLYIIAIAHLHRPPGYWNERVTS